MKTLKKLETKQGTTKGYGHFFKLLAQILEKSMQVEVQADQSIVQNLLDIMDRIEENMDTTAAMEREADF
jgi:hypothetical protein